MSIAKLICLTGILFFSLTLQGQQKIDGKTQLKQLILLFNGNWSGSGQFANGKPISAIASFTAPLDSSWIMYTHTDDPPNQYKAISMWGIDASTGNLIAEIFDNFGGRRLFTVDKLDGKLLTLNHADTNKSGKRIYQRFRYQVSDKNKFGMRYEVSTDSLTWHLGDELIFNRVN